MFGIKKKVKYSYPSCPKCGTKGVLVSQGIRQCLFDICNVTLLWKGGFTNDNFSDLSENILHEDKENTMADIFLRYQKNELAIIQN